MEDTHAAVGEKGNAPNDERKSGHVAAAASKNGGKIATQPATVMAEVSLESFRGMSRN